MIPLFKEKELNSAKSRDFLPLKCKFCGKTFHRTKSQIQAALAGNHSNCSLCGIQCRSKYGNRHKPENQTVTCKQCCKTFTRWNSQITKSKNHFCSRSCAAKWNNAHKKHGTRVSKLEKWLAEQLTKLFPDLEFHFNRKDAINSELDIYIPSLRLAFELNGIYHYEPIHGSDKLASIQSNDHRKMLACAEKEIELCVIDSSSLKYFKPAKATKFLEIISSITSKNLQK